MLAASYHSFGVQAVEVAVSVLRNGRSALDAVEAGLREVETLGDRSVGLSGMPNWEGDVELDAGIMDGDALRACGVTGVKRIRHPITLARKCLEHLPHTLIAGERLTELAKALGLEVVECSGAPAERLKERRRLEGMVAEGSARPLEYYRKLVSVASKLWHDTAGLVTVDSRGSVAAGTTTSGIAFKFPGRVSDSAVCGAGFYADSRYGAAICTGVGEVAMCTLAAFRAVHLLSRGLNPREAAREVIEAAAEIARLNCESYQLGVVVASKEEVGAMALNWSGFTYVYWLGREIGVERAPSLEAP